MLNVTVYNILAVVHSETFQVTFVFGNCQSI